MIRLERILLACFSMLLVLSSCSVKEVEPSFDGGRIEQIVAAVEHHSSKTSLAGNRRTVLWSPGDAINVFYGSSSAKFVSVNSEPEDVTLFRSPDTYIAGGSEGASKYIWAVYPYSSDNKSDGMSVTMTVPSKQLAREGTFADKSFPSVGRSKNTNVAFYNLCGGISFTLSRSDVRRVVFRSSNGASLCGKVKVIFDAEGYPCVSDYLDPCDSVVLATNGESFMADSTYYLACLPAALDGGFTIDLYTNGMKGTRSSAKSNVIKRSVFGNLGVIDRGVEFSEFHGVIADFIEAVDLGLSVKWAPFNVGAANSEQLGDLFAWGETRTKAVFEWQNYKWAFIDNSPYSFWNAILKLEDDAARTNWGGAWRMATDSELRELEYNCDVKNVTLNGVHGLQYTSKINGNSIFFPLFIIDGHPCATWTSSRWRFLTSDYDVSLERAYGLPVRPVLSNQIKSIKIAQDKLVTGQHDSLVLAFSVTPETGIHEEYVWTSSNPEVAEVDVYGTIRTKAAGEALITVTAVDGGASASCAITVKAVSVPEMVDLGLSVKWASFNIGAKSPEGSGDLFAWGETEPYYITGEADKDHPVWKPGKESGYVRANYKWYDPTSSYYSKYTSKDYSLAGDDKYILDPEDDAATQLLGENWRMPTYKELQELLSNCSREPVTINGVEGYKFTSRMTGYTDKWIFIPYAGNRIGVETTSSDQFWTSNTDGRNYAYTRYGTYDRYYGLPVRPVSGGKPVIPVEGIYIDDSAITLPLGSQSSLRVRYSPIYTTERSVIWASDNERVAVVSQDGLVTAVAAGTAVITVSTPDLSMRESCNVTVIPTSNDSLVDLGLSVKWASCNLGASKPEEVGDYYAWGETDPYYEPGQARESSPTWKQGKSEGYTWESYKWCNGSNTSFTKYCLYPEDGTVDHQYLLLPEDDAAAVILGGDWRMPTYDEAMELVEKCSWSSATVNGMDGYIVSSLIQGYEGRYIFMPRSGHRYKGILYRFGETAHFYVKNPRYYGSAIEAYGRSLSNSIAGSMPNIRG